MENIITRDGFHNMDFERVTEMLSKAFWCPGIKLDEVKQRTENSALVVGAFTKEGLQVGFGRVISDKTRFAYICDVIVDESFRRKGIGRQMVNHMLGSSELSDVYQWLLITKDAHGVYQKSGFVPFSRPEAWMEITNKRPERGV
ncbi:MAG TPA: GNAT family N-acetyltransferase [Negativicutes bacterium]|nr:GNAT family N-acetyltransferase [Negativicutes bacterium]